MSEFQIGDAPIEQAYSDNMRAIAEVLDGVLNGEKTGKDRTVGFVLLVFPFADHEGRCNYVSNAQREDVTVLLREQLARFQGAPDQTGNA